MECKIVDSITIYRGGNTGCQPMADIIYMVDGIGLETVTIQWDVPDQRNEVLKYINGYTLIDDKRI